MSERYGLEIFPKAEQDMEDIFSYISHEQYVKEAARNLIEKFNNSLERVRIFPSSCPLARNESILDKSLRKLIVENYIIFYRIHESKKAIQVIRVLYGMQNYNDIL